MDLADYDVVADDCDLIVGPLTTTLSTSNTGPSRQLGSSSSCKDCSILSTSVVAYKLAQSAPTPVHPILARYLSAVENNVYGSGNPIIAKASPASRPASGVPLQDRKNATSGFSTQAQGDTPSSQASGQARPAAISDCPAADQADPYAPRMYGDILAGGGDGEGDGNKNAVPKKANRLFRRNSSRCQGPNPGGADTTPTDTAPSQQTSSDAMAAGADGRVDGWMAAGYGTNRRDSALPCVDVEGDRSGRRLLRYHSLNNGEPVTRVMVTVQSLTAPGLQGGKAAGPCAPTPTVPPTDRQTYGTTAPRPRAPVVEIPSLSEPPSTSLRLLNKLLSGSLKSPRPAEQPSRRTSKDRRGSFGGLRDLFSRQPSWRNSEAGSILDRRASNEGHRDEVSQELSSVGGGRQASGILKRPTSPLVAWV